MQQSQSALQSKEIYRKISRETRLILLKNKSFESISSGIVENIKKLDIFKISKNIMIYYPKNTEIDLRGLLNKDKNFYLPRCSGKNLDVCPFENESQLKEGKYGILEPITEAMEDLSIIDIVFIPALCADKNFNRIGYGGGFYDRFLSNESLRAKKITVVPDELLYNSIPSEKTDIRSDMIITQSRII